MFDVVSLLWLLPLSFMVHDLEEIITVESWMSKNRGKLYERLPRRIAENMDDQLSMTTSQFSVAVLVMFLFLVSSTMWTVQTLPTGAGANYTPYLACLNIYFLHAFMHIGQAAFFGGYTPGVVTSVLVVIPYSLYAYHELLSQQVIQWYDIWWALPWGLLAVPVLLFAHEVGKRSIKPPIEKNQWM